ncbi:MAG TPA: ankyrin repeat domain-containing protein [Burkholderiales bacterium]|nr:ankyrin repeat domain-containing protein [Burkholderiales bacterium]
MNEKLKSYLGDAPDLYPHALEARYPHVIEKILAAWPSPERAVAVFEELLVDKRGGRQGFPADVAREIFRLSVAYDELRVKPLKLAYEGLHGKSLEQRDVWGVEGRERGVPQADTNLKLRASDLFRAAENPDTSPLLLFLKAGMAADTRDARDWTSLMVASFHGNVDAAKLLIEYGADPQARDRGGYTPLHWAAMKGFLTIIELLAPRADCNARSAAGLTPLLQAATGGHTAGVQVLIAAGADPNVASNEGWTPLHKAVMNGHIEVVKLLLAAGASALAEHSSGDTPISLATKAAREDILEALRAAGAPAPR